MFKGKIKQIISDMHTQRQLAGIDIPLKSYIEQIFPGDKNATVEKMFHELGINPLTMTVGQMFALDEDSRWLFPEIMREAIRKGVRKSPWYTGVIIREEPISQPSLTMPFLNLSNAEAQILQQGESIPVGSVSYGNKNVYIKKRGIGITMPYEAIQFCTLSMISIFLEDVGVKLGTLLSKDCVDVLINGEQANGSESAAVIGVKSTSAGLTYRDELTVHTRASLLGRKYDTVIANENEMGDLLNLPEHKQPYSGSVLQEIKTNTPAPSNINGYVDGNVPENQYIYVDRNFAIIQLTAQPLTMENDKIVQKQLSGIFATLISGFAIALADARVIVDRSKSFASNGFPASMNPTA